MLEPESVGVKINMSEVTVESATANNGDELLRENGDISMSRKEEDEKSGDNGNDVGCVQESSDASCAEKESSNVEEETEKNVPDEVVVEKSSSGERENNEESSVFPPEVEDTAAKVPVFQEEDQSAQKQPQQQQQLPLRMQPVPYQQVMLSQPVPCQQVPSRQPVQYINQPSQPIQTHNLPFSHRHVQCQKVPLNQRVKYQNLPVNQPVHHLHSSRQVLREANCQIAQHHMPPQSIHPESEIQPEPLLGKGLSPPIRGPLGHDAPEHLSQEVLAAAAAMALAAPVYDPVDPTGMMNIPPMKQQYIGDYAPVQPTNPAQQQFQYKGGQYQRQYAPQFYGQPHVEANDATAAIQVPQSDSGILQLCHNCYKEGITTFKPPRRWCNECRSRKRAKND